MVGPVGCSPAVLNCLEVRRLVAIDWSKFPKYAGLKPDDLVTLDLAKDKTSSPTLVDDLLAQGSDLKSLPSEGNRPIALKFRTAVQLVIDWINSSPADGGSIRLNFLVDHKSLYEDILHDLWFAPTPEAGLLSRAPTSVRFKSAGQSHVNNLFGAIIHMLFHANLIVDYGQRCLDYFVQLK